MSIDDELAQWDATVPAEIRADVLWKSTAYRLATFAADYIWPDIGLLSQDPRTRDIAAQLFRAVGSIGSNYAEAYSRGTDRDRCRIYEYALGSTRESRDWIYKSRRVIGEERAANLLALLTRIIQLLTVTIVRERSRNSRLGSEPERSRRPMRRREAADDEL